ncbi:hypothetical protein CI238_06668 [Colletotrichum incanum]|uniref:Uncharacterized protein n=1 Tax=Colletotrichum incanum TaxID=1573173 RepID=A0A167B5K3_COLIC|nr:hypothetical protein CI238_06668 [Colletotrichum incanum]
MAVARETPDDTPAHVPKSGDHGLANILTTGSKQDKIAKADNKTLNMERINNVHPVEMQSKDSPSTKTGDFVFQVEGEGNNEGPNLQDGDSTSTEPGAHPKRWTAGYGTNWLLIFISFLTSYSIYTYHDGIPDDEMIPLDWFLKYAMGRFWNPSAGYLVVVIAVFISNTVAVGYRQGYQWIVMVGFSGAFAHVPVGVWYDGWEETLLRDLPIRLMVAPIFLQLIIPIEAWTGWDITRERQMREHYEAVERKRKEAKAKDDCEAQGMEERGDGDDEPLMDDGGRREGYGAC